jgi:hypothetical protein
MDGQGGEQDGLCFHRHAMGQERGRHLQPRKAPGHRVTRRQLRLRFGLRGCLECQSRSV